MTRKEELEILIKDVFNNISRKYDRLVECRLENIISNYEELNKQQLILDKYIKEYKNDLNITYVVLSRDFSKFTFITKDKELAEKVKLERINEEEKQGGRPSVYINEIKDK